MAPTLEYTSFNEIEKIHTDLTQTFLAASLPSLVPLSSAPKSTSPYPLLSIPYRQHQLHQLVLMLQEHSDDWCEALAKDLGKPKREVLMAEIGPTIEKALACARGVGEWVRERDLNKEEGRGGLEEYMSTWGVKVETRAKGVALIISPWNYPLILTFQPLYGALAAGCPAVLKPSEMVPHFAALVAELVPKYLDPAAYRVVLGAVPEITKVLELKWDHIMYTGNGKVARIISAAAAKHLTPLTLELGGKSPVIVDPETCGDLDVVAKRIIWGKSNNAGQICVAPDYVLIPHAAIPAFVDGISKALDGLFPEGALNSEDYGRIISDLHFNRVVGLLKATKGRVVLGGRTSDDIDGDSPKVNGKGGRATKDRGIEPTVVVFSSVEEAGDDVTMQEEIFGPILPVVGVRNLVEALEFVRKRDHPLVLYAFTNDEGLKRTISDSTMSGNLVFNDTFQQLAVSAVPFGGVGESGYGRQSQKYSFEEFVYQRAVVDIPQSAEELLSVRYPPTSEQSLAFFSQILSAPVGEVTASANGTDVNGNGKAH